MTNTQQYIILFLLFLLPQISLKTLPNFLLIAKEDSFCTPITKTLQNTPNINLQILTQNELNYNAINQNGLSHFYTCELPDYTKLNNGKFSVSSIIGGGNLFNKQKLTQNLYNYDNLHLYPFNTTQLLPKSYLIDTNSNNFNQQEQIFFNLTTKQHQNNIYITKDYSQQNGHGIQFHTNLSQLQQHLITLKQNEKQNLIKNKQFQTQLQQQAVLYLIFRQNQNIIVQEYLQNPLLWNRKKFDIRSYIFIVSTDPLVVLFQHAYIRISPLDYSTNGFQKQEISRHLPNNYDSENGYSGGKNRKKNLKDFYKELLINQEKFTQNDIEIFDQNTKSIILYAVLAGIEEIGFIQGQHLLLGSDIIIDENYNQYLLEFNKNPILEQSKEQDEILPDYQNILDSYIQIILKTYENSPKQAEQFWQNPDTKILKNWQILYNEAQNYNFLHQTEQEKKETSTKKLSSLLNHKHTNFK